MANNHHSYKIGDTALSCDIETSHAADAESKRAASSFRVGDGAFVRRSDRIWRYAVISDVSLGTTPCIEFTVSADGASKKVGPHHWGDRVRPLKRQTAVGRDRNISSHLKKKDLRSSWRTQVTSPFDSQSSAELERSANQAGGDSLRRSVRDKSSDDGSDDTNEPAEVLDEVISNQRQQDPPGIKRRESFKDMALGTIRKKSGGSKNPERRTPINRLASSDTTKAPEDMKIPEFNEKLPSPIDIEGADTNEPAEVLDEVISKQRQQEKQAPPGIKRRESFKNMASGIIRKKSGGSRNPERRAPINRLASDTTKAPEDEDVKIHEFNEGLPSPIDIEGAQNCDETPVAIKTIGSDATKQNRRKPNSRRNRGSFTLTTSLLFRNLMKGTDVLGDSNAPKAKANRRATVDFVAANEEGDAAARGSNGIAPSTKAGKYMHRRSHRRATVQGPSPAIVDQPRAQRAASATSVMRNAFTQLMEEKRLYSSQQQIGVGVLD